MKKKIIAVSFAVAFALVLGVVLNPKEVKGDGTCSVQRTFFSMEAVDANGKNANKDVNTTDTTKYQKYNGKSDVEVTDTHPMTASECVSYYNNQQQRYDNGIATDETYCTTDESTGIESCTNSGSAQTGLSSSFNSALDQIDGNSVSEKCQNFVENYNVQADVSMNKSEGENYELVKDSLKDNETAIDINKQFNTDSGSVIGDTYFVATTYVVTDTYTPGAGESCPDEVEKKKKRECKGGSGSVTFSGCTSQSKSATITYTANGTFSATEYVNEDNYKHCGIDKNTVNYFAKADITQTGGVSYSVGKNKIHAGGGIGFAINYSVGANWVYCDEASEYGEAIVTLNEHTAKCIDSSCPVAAKDCSFDKATLSNTAGYCDCSYICDDYDSDGEWIGTSSYSSKILVDCDSISQYNLTTQYPSLAPNDKKTGVAKAEADIESQIGSGVTAPTVFAPHSNDETITSVNLTSNVNGQGQAATASSGGRSFSVSINQACINKYNPFDVKYITSGSCSDYSTDYVVGYIDGGNNYYVPLKYPDKEYFTFSGSSNGLSIVNGMTWTMSYDCNVKVEQKIYNTIPSGGGSSGGSGGSSSGGSGTGSGGYKFVYRPIDLSNPFPNRKPSSNWTAFVNTSLKNGGSGAYDKYMKRDITEYSMTLTTSTIEAIKTMNDVERNDKNRDYNSLNTISLDGKSALLNDIIGSSRKTKYNKLGECNRKVTTIVNGVETSGSILDGTECW